MKIRSYLAAEPFSFELPLAVFSDPHKFSSIRFESIISIDISGCGVTNSAIQSNAQIIARIKRWDIIIELCNTYSRSLIPTDSDLINDYYIF